MDIPQILSKRYPGSLWKLEGDDYAGLTWKSDTAKTSEAALVKVWPSVQLEYSGRGAGETRR